MFKLVLVAAASLACASAGIVGSAPGVAAPLALPGAGPLPLALGASPYLRASALAAPLIRTSPLAVAASPLVRSPALALGQGGVLGSYPLGLGGAPIAYGPAPVPATVGIAAPLGYNAAAGW